MMDNVDKIKQMNLTKEDIKRLLPYLNDRLLLDFKRGMSFSDLLIYKRMVSSQKFSDWFGKQQIRVLGWGDFSERKFDVLDAKDGSDNIEMKYATHTKSGASFPQLIRLDYLVPDRYVISIFKDNELFVFDIPGVDLHNSKIRKACTRAHANNPNELRCTIKYKKHNKISEEWKFLEKYHSVDLVNKLKKAVYIL